MSSLTCGERIVRCFLGEEIDRLPFAMGIGWAPWGETLERWKIECDDPQLDITSYFSFEKSFHQPSLYSGIFPEFNFQVLEESERFIISRDTRGIVMRNRRDGGSMPEFLDYPVKTPADWEKLKQERLDPTFTGRVNIDWEAFHTRLKETGEAVQVGSFPFGVFGTPRDFMGAEELLVAFYSEPEMVRDMMNHLTTLWLAIWEEVAAHVQIDHIHIWEDMSGRQGSLISPAMVESFMMPCYDRIVDFARAHQVRLVSVDTDGDCNELVPLMMNHGINLFLPFEVQAGNDIRQYRDKYPTLGITGGLDKRALAASKADIDEQLDLAEEMVQRGRYVPAFDHLIPPDVSWENYAYAAHNIKDLCLNG